MCLYVRENAIPRRHIFMPEGRSGKATIHVSYKGTKYQTKADAISASKFQKGNQSIY